MKDLVMNTGLHRLVVTKVVKSLENKRIIKNVKSVKVRRRSAICRRKCRIQAVKYTCCTHRRRQWKLRAALGLPIRNWTWSL